MKTSWRSILCHSFWTSGHNLKWKYVSFSRNLFVQQMIYCSLSGTAVFLIFLSEAINMPCFNFISRMHDLQWGKLSRSYGSYGIRQDLSALGSSEATSAQIRARKVKYHQPCYQWFFSQGVICSLTNWNGNSLYTMFSGKCWAKRFRMRCVSAVYTCSWSWLTRFQFPCFFSGWSWGASVECDREEPTEIPSFSLPAKKDKGTLNSDLYDQPELWEEELLLNIGQSPFRATSSGSWVTWLPRVTTWQSPAQAKGMGSRASGPLAALCCCILKLSVWESQVTKSTFSSEVGFELKWLKEISMLAHSFHMKHLLKKKKDLFLL